MKPQLKLILGTSVIAILVFSVGIYFYKQKQSDQEEKVVQENIDRLMRFQRPSQGPANAPVTIVEFMDPECESCGRFHHTVKSVLAEFPKDVRLIIRYFPLHTNSVYASSLLEIAGARGKFWDLLELMFAKQSEWASHRNPKPELLMGYVEELGFNKTDFETALKDIKYETRVKYDEADARALGVTGTPTFYINGKKLARLSYADMRTAIEDALKTSR